ncbi:MAG: hypothetical protein K2X82_02720 [Gemmataceae bacterium]|nr:hypothetical protein [Gemmataceae bacterium]
MSSDAAPYRSVTEIDSPVHPIGPLEPELLAAFNLAAALTRWCQTAVLMSRNAPALRSAGADPSVSSRAVLWNLARIRDELPYTPVLLGVFNPLTRASEPTARFGGASAHDAALRTAHRLHLAAWQAADGEGCHTAHVARDPDAKPDPALTEREVERVCFAVAREDWPDFDAMLVAIQVEAAKASVGPKPRLELDDNARAVWLDDKLLAEGLKEDSYHFLKAVAAGQGAAVTGAELAGVPGGYEGKKWKRDVLDPMPAAVRPLVVPTPGAGGGYSLRLPPPPRKPRPGR